MKMSPLAVAALILASIPPGAEAQAPAQSAAPARPTATPANQLPSDWTDKTTGHRVRRISTENGSSSNYFNINPYTPDGRWMVFSSPSGIMSLDLKTWKTKLVIPGQVSLLFVGTRTGIVYYTMGVSQTQGHDARSAYTPGAAAAPATSQRGGPRALMAFNLDTGQSRQIRMLDPSYGISTINADETLFAGARTTTAPAPVGPNGGGTRDPAEELLPNGKKATYAEGREIQINRRLTANLPMEIYTINIATGEKKTVTSGVHWYGHLQSSPTNPDHLLYCHEGNWHVVDRMWLINVKNGQAPKNLHGRTMNMEIAGHEWWSADGKTVWYDLQTPRGEVFWVAGYNVDTGKRAYYAVERNAWGVHFNSSPDDKLFLSDGGDNEMAAHAPDGKYIHLLRPRDIPDVAGISAPNSAELIKPGVLDPERLVDLNTHNYRSEPNASFTPDGKWIVFRSNMHGPGHVYAVEVAKPAK